VRRTKMREQIEQLTRSAGDDAPDDFCTAWVASAAVGAPLLFVQRRRHLVIRAGDEVLVAKRRRRNDLEREDVVARIPLEASSLRRTRHLGLLRQVVLAAPEAGAVYALEFGLGARRFADELTSALR